MRIDFTGKRVFVTGGAKGIGRATVDLLTAAGADVWVFDREAEDGQRSRRLDVVDGPAVKRAFAEIGAPDAVIANAGIARNARIDETTPSVWQQTLDVNLTGVFHTLQAAAELMKPNRRGSIVITASTNSYDGEATLIAYNATKAGVLGILHTAANELGLWGIRVNAVCPGLIRTPLTSDYFNRSEVLKEYFRHIPMGRGGEADEVANAIVFLASDLASYITGATLLVDGGQLCCKYAEWKESAAEFDGQRWRLK